MRQMNPVVIETQGCMLFFYLETAEHWSECSFGRLWFWVGESPALRTPLTCLNQTHTHTHVCVSHYWTNSLLISPGGRSELNKYTTELTLLSNTMYQMHKSAEMSRLLRIDLDFKGTKRRRHLPPHAKGVQYMPTCTVKHVTQAHQI